MTKAKIYKWISTIIYLLIVILFFCLSGIKSIDDSEYRTLPIAGIFLSSFMFVISLRNLINLYIKV